MSMRKRAISASPATAVVTEERGLTNKPSIKHFFHSGKAANNVVEADGGASSLNVATAGSPGSVAGSRGTHSTASPVPSVRYMTWAEFRYRDVKRRRQRHVLHALKLADIKAKVDEKAEGKEVARKPFKEPKFKEDKKGLGKLGGLLSKKRKKRTRAAAFHLINMAIHDHRTSQACILVDDLNPASLRKKFPVQATRAFVSAMVNSMEAVCCIMLDKGFPVSVNTPISMKGVGAPTAKSAPAPGGAAAGTAGATGGAAGAEAATVAAGTVGPPVVGATGYAGTSEVDFPTYFMVAIGLGLDNVVRNMIKRADVNQPWHGLTPLHLAASRNAFGIAQILLEAGASPNVGMTCSQYALLRRFKSLSSNSVRRSAATGLATIDQAGGAKEEAGQQGDQAKKRRGVFGFSEEFMKGKKVYPVELAAACGHHDMVKLLLSKMDARTLQNSAFALLVQRNFEITILFIRCGVPIAQRDHVGSMAIHLACRAGDLNQVVALKECGADINAPGQNQWTPLHEALAQKRLEVAKYLLRKGVDANVCNAGGETARDIGVKAGVPASDLDECFGTQPSDTVPDWEHDVANQVKFIRFTSGPVSTGSSSSSLVGLGHSHTSGTSNFNVSSGSVFGSGATAPGGAGFNVGVPTGKKGPDMFLQPQSKMGKFSSFLRSGRMEEKATSSDMDLSSLEKAGVEKKAGGVGLLKSRFGRKTEG
ncbi:BRCA1-associated RING domain protein 1 [Irineochytrium annulatum]|nr:BRCA1-associated RING domain protein 1 [Irineochytrium annulatum]